MYDLAKNPVMDNKKLCDFLAEIERQPNWRVDADLCADCYDSYQTTPDVQQTLNLRGQPDFVHNLVAPAIDGACGMEAKMRTAWQVLGDTDDDTEVAEAIGHKLFTAARITRSDRAISDAYKASLIAGLGWVEVSRNSDPTEYDYRTGYVHRNEIYYDWATKEPDLSDCRWLVRDRLLEKDQLISTFPQHEDLISQLAGAWASGNWSIDEVMLRSPDFVGDIAGMGVAKAQMDKWIDISNRRVRVYEVYYRHYIRQTMLKTNDGQVIEYNPKNQFQAAAIIAKQAIILPNAPIRKMRMSYFIGPFRIADMDSHHPHNMYPYVPFWGYREDRTRSPYGVVRRMRPAQDEINVRRRKLTALLNKVLVTKDEDAITNMSDAQLIDEVSKQAGVVNLNKGRLNKERGIQVEWGNGSISEQQFRVMSDAKQLIQDTGGLYSAYLGQESNATSGVAINSLVEQGSITQGEINDNMRFSKQLVGELLLAHIVQDVGGEQEEVSLYSDDKAKKTKFIKLNEPEVVDGRVVKINNSVQMAKLRIAVADSSTAPGYRQQMADNFMNILQGLPPAVQAALIPIMLEMTDLPNRHEAIKAIKEATGGTMPEDMTPEQQAAAEQQKQEEAQLKQIEFKRLEAEAEKIMAEARKINADVDAGKLDQNKAAAEIREIEARTKKLISETVAIRQKVITDIKTAAEQYGVDTEGKKDPGPPNNPEEIAENQPATAGFFSP